MLSAIQGNVIKFADRNSLVDNIVDEVNAEWMNNWRNEIIFGDQEGRLVIKNLFLAIFFALCIVNVDVVKKAKNYLPRYHVTMTEGMTSSLLM